MRGFIVATLAACALAQQGTREDMDMKDRWEQCLQRASEEDCKKRFDRMDGEGRDGDRTGDREGRGEDLWEKCMQDTKDDYRECERQKTDRTGYWEGVPMGDKSEWEREHRHDDRHGDEMDIYDGVSFLMGDAATKISATAAVVAAAALAVSM